MTRAAIVMGTARLEPSIWSARDRGASRNRQSGCSCSHSAKWQASTLSIILRVLIRRIALNDARRNPVLTLTWRDTLYTHKSNAFPQELASISVMEVSRKIIYIKQNSVKKYNIARTIFYLLKNIILIRSFIIIHYYCEFEIFFILWFSLNYQKWLKNHRYRQIEKESCNLFIYIDKGNYTFINKSR